MFRFTIRELFLLIFTMAIALGWWADRRQMLNRCNEQAVEIHQLRSLMTPQVR
jgi:hypothetical protein